MRGIRIALITLGLALCSAAQGQETTVGAVAGPEGIVAGAIASIEQVDAQPLIHSSAGGTSGLIQGTAGAGLRDVLGGVLVSQNPERMQSGLELIITGLLESLAQGLGLDMSGDLSLDALSLPSDGLPGLPGGESLTPSQLEDL